METMKKEKQSQIDKANEKIKNLTSEKLSLETALKELSREKEKLSIVNNEILVKEKANEDDLTRRTAEKINWENKYITCYSDKIELEIKMVKRENMSDNIEKLFKQQQQIVSLNTEKERLEEMLSANIKSHQLEKLTLQNKLNVCKTQNNETVEMIESTYRKINHYDKNEEVRQNLQPLPDTREVMNAIYRYCIMLETKIISVKNEIKGSIDFVKKNFTSIIPSVESSLNKKLNDYETIVDLLKTVFGELEKENLKILSLFNQTLSQCKTNFTEVKEHLEICRIEIINVTALVSLQ